MLCLKGLGAAPGPSPKCGKCLASCLPEDVPELGNDLPEYGSVAKDMRLWPQMKFVRGFESGAASAVLQRHLCLKTWGDSVPKGLGLGTGSEP